MRALSSAIGCAFHEASYPFRRGCNLVKKCSFRSIHQALPTTTVQGYRQNALELRPFAAYTAISRTRYFSNSSSPLGTTSSLPQDGPPNSYLTSNVIDLMSLRDRVVVITGAAKGIGLALAFAVSEAGGKVAIIDSASEPQEAYTMLEKQCAQVKYYRSDVTDYETLQSTFADVIQDFGSINGLITAAGICPDEPFLERSPQSVKRCMEINNLGTYYSAQLAARQMVKQKREAAPESSSSVGAGSIVLIASVAAHRASKDQYTSDYCMSKGGVLSLTRQLGVELAEKQIRVNCISPGYISTDMTADLIKERPNLGEVFNSQPALKRIGDRTDLKAASVFLLSNASAYMTSGEMLITGGLHAGNVH